MDFNYASALKPSLQIDISLHSVTLSRFQANQSLFFLLNVECLAEKQQIPIFGVTQQWLEPTICHTQGKHAKTITKPKCLNHKDVYK